MLAMLTRFRKLKSAFLQMSASRGRAAAAAPAVFRPAMEGRRCPESEKGTFEPGGEERSDAGVPGPEP